MTDRATWDALTPAQAERIWVRGLTQRMRNLLVWVAQHADHEPWPPWANGNTVKSLCNRGYITAYSYRLTDEGRRLIEVNAGYALIVEDTEIELTEDANALTKANARITALESENAQLRAALERIIMLDEGGYDVEELSAYRVVERIAIEVLQPPPWIAGRVKHARRI